MNTQHSHDASVSTAVAQAQSAFLAGDLTDYPALAASGAEEAKATITTSWGPQMRR